jgi:hypothetical protein
MLELSLYIIKSYFNILFIFKLVILTLIFISNEDFYEQIVIPRLSGTNLIFNLIIENKKI